jgi:hypothetical protein
MSGRGKRNRGRGRFSGRSRGMDSFATRSIKETASSLEDHVYQVGQAADAGDYNKITEFIMTHIRKTFVHGARVATSLERRQVVQAQVPRLKRSQSTDAAIESLENDEFKIQYDQQLKMYYNDEAKFKLQMEKAYGLLLSQCSLNLQHKIKTMAFEGKLKENPIELLAAIGRHSVNAVPSRNPYDVVVDSWINLVKTRQRNNETVLDYTQRFLSAKDMYEALAGGQQYAETLVLNHPKSTQPTRIRLRTVKLMSRNVF